MKIEMETLFSLLSNPSSPPFSSSRRDVSAGCEAPSELSGFTAQRKGQADAKLNRCDVLASLNISDCTFCGS